MNVKPMRGRYQLRVVNKLLPKDYYKTFDTREQAEEYGSRLEAMLKAGMVPRELAAEAPSVVDPLMLEVINSYEQLGPVTPFDKEMLSATTGDMLGIRVSDITSEWVDLFIKRLKMVANNSPGTIRKKVGVYGRILDWHLRRVTPHGKQAPPNPFRNLPRGYSTYTKEDAKQLALAPEVDGKRKAPKKDQIRERRLLQKEDARVQLALKGEKVTPDAVWVRPPNPDMQMLFETIVDTGMRLREAYTLRKSHLQLDRGFTRVDGSKGRDGNIKPRIVPLKPALIAKLRAYADDKTDILFPWWDGTQDGKKKATRALVQAFRRLFAHAKVPQFTEHDLRHEACCRWFELRGTDGRWLYSDVEICKIMGWSDYSMVLRYASLRGEDLAARMSALGPGGTAAAATAAAEAPSYSS